MSKKKGPPKKGQDEFMEAIDPKPYAGDTITVTAPLGAAIAVTADLPPLADLGQAGMGSSIEPDINAQEEALKARAAAMEGYIKAGVAKCMIAIEGHEIVGAAQFRAAMEAILRHLHEDHPENYLP